MRLYQQGDKVSYCGKKFASDLNGKLGEVVARVEGTEHGIVVDFGDNAYVLDEEKHVTRFRAAKGGAEPQVERRRARKDEDDS